MQEAVVGLELGALLAQLGKGGGGGQGRAGEAVSGGPTLPAYWSVQIVGPAPSSFDLGAQGNRDQQWRSTSGSARPGAHLRHAVIQGAKDEHVVLPNLLRNLNVGAVLQQPTRVGPRLRG